MTTFSGVLRGGGTLDLGAGHELWVDTVVNCYSVELEGININSPDINGDLVVNLSDVVEFARDYFGDDDYRSDFYWDGSVDLSDLVLMAQGIGASCP